MTNLLDDSTLISPLFTFDALNRQLIIDSPSDSSATGVYEIKYEITNLHSGISDYSSFLVTVKCDIASTPPAVTDFAY